MRASRRLTALVFVVALVVLLWAGAACDRSQDTWRFETRRPFFFAGDSQAFTPAVRGDTLFFCGGYSYNAWSELVALSAADGRVRWRFPVESCSAPPVVVESIVVAIARHAHTSNAVWYGIDAGSGTEKWRQELGRETAFHAAAGDSIYLTRPNGGLERVHAGTGRIEQVQLDTNRLGRVWLAAADDVVLVGDGAALWRIEQSGSNPQRMPALSADVGAVRAAVSDGRLLVIEDRENRLIAFDVASGQARWMRTWPRLLSAPALVADQVLVNVFGPNRYELEAIDAVTGTTRWGLQDGGFEPPTAAGREIYTAGQTGAWIVGASNGTVSRRIESTREIITAPIAVGKLLLFGTIDGKLRAVTIARAK